MSDYPTRSYNVTRPLPKQVEESAHARILRRAGAQAEWPKGPRVGASKAEEPWNADTNYFVTISLPLIHASSSQFIILERWEGRPLPSRSPPLLSKLPGISRDVGNENQSLLDPGFLNRPENRNVLGKYA